MRREGFATEQPRQKSDQNRLQVDEHRSRAGGSAMMA